MESSDFVGLKGRGEDRNLFLSFLTLLSKYSVHRLPHLTVVFSGFKINPLSSSFFSSLFLYAVFVIVGSGGLTQHVYGEDEIPEVSPCKLLQKAVQRTQKQNGFHIDTHFTFEQEGESEPLKIRSKGIIENEDRFFLKTQTYTNMTVKSFGAFGQVVHLDPAKDLFVTSRELGISSIDRQIQDPFAHTQLLFEENKKTPSCSYLKDRSREQSSLVLEARPSVDVIEQVATRIQNLYDKTIDPKKTRVHYRFYLNSSKIIHRIQLEVETEIRQRKKQKQSEEEEKVSDVEKQLREEMEDSEGRQSIRTIRARISGEFSFSKFGKNTDIDIPKSALRKLKSLREN